MHLRGRCALLAIAALSAGAATHAAGTDCPQARSAYSSNTFLMDILLDPAAAAILNKDAPEFLPSLPEELKKASPPSFTAILTPRMIATIANHPSAAELAKLDQDLAAVKITRAAMRTRCARYDEVAPLLPHPVKHPALLVFEKINGFRDGPSVTAASAFLEQMARRRGWTLIATKNGAVFNKDQLRQFDAVIWNNVSGDALTVPQQRSLISYIESGGGFAGFHGSGGDPYYLWDWYADTLLGARFSGHPNSPQFQAAQVIVDDPKDGIVAGLPPEWTMTEEWYSFQSSPRLRGAHILARLDEASYQPVNGKLTLRMGDHPIAWTQCIKNGRSFYSAIGHRPDSYSEPNSARLLEQGIAWAAGLGATACADGREVSR